MHWHKQFSSTIQGSRELSIIRYISNIKFCDLLDDPGSTAPNLSYVMERKHDYENEYAYHQLFIRHRDYNTWHPRCFIEGVIESACRFQL